MELIGKTLNYIKLNNFLDRIEVDEIISTLHNEYSGMLAVKNADGYIDWNGHTYTEESLEDTLKEEEGKLGEITLKRHPLWFWQVILHFDSGNEFVIRIKEQEQFFKIQQFILEYK